MHTINRKWTAKLCTEYPFSIYVYDWVFVCTCVWGVWELCTEYPFSIYVYDWVFVCMCVCGCLGVMHRVPILLLCVWLSVCVHVCVWVGVFGSYAPSTHSPFMCMTECLCACVCVGWGVWELCTEYPFSIYVYDWVFVCMCVCGWGCLGACVFKLPVCSQWTTTHRIAYTVTDYSPSETVLSFLRCPVQRLSCSESDEQFQATWDRMPTCTWKHWCKHLKIKCQHVHVNIGVH